jgi:signal transduction histidine kinase
VFGLGFWLRLALRLLIPTWRRARLLEQLCRNRQAANLLHHIRLNSTRPGRDCSVNPVRVNWQIKAILPVVLVLLAGLLLFTIATVTLRDNDRDALLLLAGVGAVIVCGVSISVLTYLVQRPMVELQEKMAIISTGNLDVAVSFSQSNDEIGDLGRKFNHMVQQLRESRLEIETMHRTQMSRAEHLATLGELATGLAHEIRNPLAGIAGVIDIIGRDLPASSPARAMVKDVRLEINQINRILTDLLETARPHPPQMMRSNLNTTVEHAVMLARQQVLSQPINPRDRYRYPPPNSRTTAVADLPTLLNHPEQRQRPRPLISP